MKYRNDIVEKTFCRDKSKTASNAIKSRDARTACGVRRRIDPTTTDMQYNPAELEFFKAMQNYKEANRRPFPTLKETLEVLLSLGYRKSESVTEQQIA